MATPKTAEHEPRYLTTDEVAEHYRTAPATIRYWRHVGYGPRGVRVGRRVLYPSAELSRFDTELRAAAEGGEVGA
jgi:hypothetical protein